MVLRCRFLDLESYCLQIHKEPFRKEIVLATKLFITPEEYKEGLEEAIRRHLKK